MRFWRLIKMKANSITTPAKLNEDIISIYELGMQHIMPDHNWSVMFAIM
jgi:hypothetical protein